MYTYHCLSEENAVLLESCPESYSAEERKWRDELCEGMEVDAAKVEPLLECRCWARAKILKKITATGDDLTRVQLSFLEDSPIYDREVSINSKDLANPADGKSSESDFRAQLKVGDRIDCYDSTKFWYASTIIGLEVRQHQGLMLPMVYVAFRVEHEKGD